MRNERPEPEREPEGPAHDPREGRWSNQELLLAMAIDELRRANWLYVAAHAKRPGPAPEPLLRPGVKPKEDSKPRYTLEQASILDPRLRAQHEAQMRAKEGG